MYYSSQYLKHSIYTIINLSEIKCTMEKNLFRQETLPTPTNIDSL